VAVSSAPKIASACEFCTTAQEIITLGCPLLIPCNKTQYISTSMASELILMVIQPEVRGLAASDVYKA
jgi:hypothetical protein